MNKIKYIVSIVCLIFCIQTIRSQSFVSRAYKTGNYVFCGKELPKTFSYIIEEEQSPNVWKSVAELKAPANEAECKARIMKLPESIASFTKIEPGVINFVWNRIQKSNQLDSLFAYSIDPRYQSVAGVGWFDEYKKRTAQSHYRISKMTKTGLKTKLSEVTISFTGEPFNGKIKPVRYKLYDNSIDISYDLSDKENTMGVKLFRSNYLQNNFTEISSKVYFTNQKETMVALLTDENATKGFTYSYVAVPYDGLGNLGIASDTLNIYYISKPADIGLITEFEIEPNPDKNGNMLKWQYNANTNVSTIDVFRSTTYNDNYKRIASLSPSQTEYFDELNIEPSITYFYYISINNGMGNSLPSARVPAILKGNKENTLPPQDLTISRKGQIVTLTFRKLGRDTRAYYVYRGDGYVTPLSQLSRMLLSTDSMLTYNDTLPLSVTPSVYSYAVASVNTSYNISPMSDRVSVSFSGGKLPIPNKVNAILQKNEVFVSWSDMAQLNSAITAYRVFRKTVKNNQQTEPEKIIAETNFETNFITDKSVFDGNFYTYRIQSVGADTTDISSLSLPASVLFPMNKSLQPGEVMAIAAEKKILLKWTLPQTDSIVSVLIFRAEENGKPELISEVGGKVQTYEDSQAVKGVRYFYFIVLKYANNAESNPTEAVSAKWE